MGKAKSEISRRNFLSTTLASAAATGLMVVPGARALAQGKPDEKPGEIIYRTLGRTGIKLPIVSMGAMNAKNPSLIQASYDIGVRHIDTAAYYQSGQNETMLGKAIKKMGIRAKLNISTKILHGGHRNRIEKGDMEKEFAIALDESLKRLQMDYVDILYLHSVASIDDINNEEIMAGMTEAKKKGKIRAIGFSTHKNMAQLIENCAQTEFYDVVLTSINVSMADNKELLSAIEKAHGKGIGIVAMKTQAGGSRFSAGQAAKYNSTVVNVASLKWVMQNENITTCIPGYDNYQHMNENFSVAQNLEYSDEENQLLSDSNVQLGVGFCHQCQDCLTSCPEDADVPTMMRTHMYAAGYANFHHARQVLNDIPSDNGLANCVSCRVCVASCSKTVNIPSNILELKAMYA